MKFQDIFRVVMGNDDLDAAEACKRRRYPWRMKQRVLFSILSLWTPRKANANKQVAYMFVCMVKPQSSVRDAQVRRRPHVWQTNGA